MTAFVILFLQLSATPPPAPVTQLTVETDPLTSEYFPIFDPTNSQDCGFHADGTITCGWGSYTVSAKGRYPTPYTLPPPVCPTMQMDLNGSGAGICVVSQ